MYKGELIFIYWPCSQLAHSSNWPTFASKLARNRRFSWASYMFEISLFYLV